MIIEMSYLEKFLEKFAFKKIPFHALLPWQTFRARDGLVSEYAPCLPQSPPVVAQPPFAAWPAGA